MAERMIIAANRLPFRRYQGHWVRSPGGLVTALTPVLGKKDGVWIGWSGSQGPDQDPFDLDGIHCVPIGLDESEIDDYYLGFCNRTIWPLLHDAVRTPEYSRRWWAAYQRVNVRFADEVLQAYQPDDIIWVHDYHLLLVPELVRRQASDAAMRFFLHIPFPPVELFARLPWRRQILEGMLGADVIGFQTQRGATNFMAAATTFTAAELSGDGLRYESRDIDVIAAPISIEVDDFARIGASPETDERAKNLRTELGEPEQVILGADRLDYTKGIDVRLRAFGELLALEPGLAETVKFVQIAVPSRQTIGDYSEMRRSIDQIAGRINSVHGHNMPVHYVYESLDRSQLVAYYRAADVMAVTPFTDGMNLVAKEYVASRVDGDGVLVLSEFAGAAQELRDALLVNPYDIDAVAAGLGYALGMGEEERRARMEAMRKVVSANDLDNWAARALGEPVTSRRRDVNTDGRRRRWSPWSLLPQRKEPSGVGGTGVVP